MKTKIKIFATTLSLIGLSFILSGYSEIEPASTNIAGDVQSSEAVVASNADALLLGPVIWANSYMCQSVIYTRDSFIDLHVDEWPLVLDLWSTNIIWTANDVVFASGLGQTGTITPQFTPGWKGIFVIKCMMIGEGTTDWSNELTVTFQ